MVEKDATFTIKKTGSNPKAELESFRAFLRNKGYRITREREIIAEAILLNSSHFDVDELFMQLKGSSGVSKASIYRTIPILIESGILAAVYLEDGHMHYERACGREHHSHLRCTSCGKIIEFSAPELPALEKAITKQKNFKTEGHKFEIWGLCSKCQ